MTSVFPQYLSRIVLSILLALASFGVAKAADIQEIRSCIALSDPNAQRHCFIDMEGYSENACRAFYTAKSVSLCELDRKKFASLDEECRRDFECYWASEAEPRLAALINFLKKRDDNPYATLEMGRSLTASERYTPLHWHDPGRGTIVFETADNRRYTFMPGKSNRRGIVRFYEGGGVIVPADMASVRPYRVDR